MSVVVGLWTFVQVTRMKREQAVVLGLLRLMMSNSDLKKELEKMHVVVDLPPAPSVEHPA